LVTLNIAWVLWAAEGEPEVGGQGDPGLEAKEETRVPATVLAVAEFRQLRDLVV
jgi:hypothetical protein